MADEKMQRPIKAFQVTAPLFNSMVSILNQLPAQTSRGILNRIEGGEVTPIFEGGDLGGHRRRGDEDAPGRPGNGTKRPSRKVARVARRKGGK